MAEVSDKCDKCGRERVPGCHGGFINVADPSCPVHKGKMTDEVCKLCDGSGWLLTTRVKCRNLLAMQIRRHLGEEIAAVKHVSESPLYESGVTDMTRRNLFIHGCPWRNLLPHLKYVLFHKGTDFQFRVTDDRRIKNIFVGAEDFRARPKDDRNYIPTFNSVSDLVGDDVELAIIKLGYLGYKNKAAAGALKEALLIRDALRLPTWLVEDPNEPWTHSCDSDVAFYIDRQFNKVHIEPTADPGTPDLHDVSGDIGHEDEDDVGPLEEPPGPDTFAFSHDDAEDEDVVDPSLDDMLNDPTLGESGKKKWKGRR